MLLGLTGKARSGKDTFGELLTKELGCRRYALGSPVKHYTNFFFGWDERCFDGVLKEELIYTRACLWQDLNRKMKIFRNYLEFKIDYKIPSNINLTEEWRTILSPYSLGETSFEQWCISPRKAYQLFGTEFGRERISDSLWTDIAPKSEVIWTDVRFPNEAEAVLENKGKIIRILRPGQEKISENSHASEQGIGDVEVFATVVNDGTIGQLKNKAVELAKIINKS